MPQVIQSAKGVTVVLSAIDKTRDPAVAAALPGPVTFTHVNDDNVTVTVSDDQTSVTIVPTDSSKDATVDIRFESGELSIADHFAFTAQTSEPVATDLVLTITQN